MGTTSKENRVIARDWPLSTFPRGKVFLLSLAEFIDGVNRFGTVRYQGYFQPANPLGTLVEVGHDLLAQLCLLD